MSSFITDFYSPTKPSAGSSSASGKASTSQQQQQQQQNTDPAFLSFVWDTLVNQEDVHVGVLSLLAAVPKEEELEEEEEDSQNGDDDEENEEEESSPKLKGKGKAKAKAPKAKRKKKARDVGKDEGTHHFEVLADEKAAWSRDKLMEEFGDTLRIAVGPDTAWTAITGSSMRVSLFVAEPCAPRGTEADSRLTAALAAQLAHSTRLRHARDCLPRPRRWSDHRDHRQGLGHRPEERLPLYSRRRQPRHCVSSRVALLLDSGR